MLGFCDVLRQLKGRRQLFVSRTVGIYRLLLSKLRPANPSDVVKGLLFEGWSDVGPQIRTEEPEFIDFNIQVAEMSGLDIGALILKVHGSVGPSKPGRSNSKRSMFYFAHC